MKCENCGDKIYKDNLCLVCWEEKQEEEELFGVRKTTDEEELKNNLSALIDKICNTNLSIANGLEELGLSEDDMPQGYENSIFEVIDYCSNCGYWETY